MACPDIAVQSQRTVPGGRLQDRHCRHLVHNGGVPLRIACPCLPSIGGQSWPRHPRYRKIAWPRSSRTHPSPGDVQPVAVHPHLVGDREAVHLAVPAEPLRRGKVLRLAVGLPPRSGQPAFRHAPQRGPCGNAGRHHPGISARGGRGQKPNRSARTDPGPRTRLPPAIARKAWNSRSKRPVANRREPLVHGLPCATGSPPACGRIHHRGRRYTARQPSDLAGHAVTPVVSTPGTDSTRTGWRPPSGHTAPPARDGQTAPGTAHCGSPWVLL